MTTWVVKLGGSLINFDGLDNWLHQLLKLSNQYQIIIVPGGGPFADQVRLAQQKSSFSDKTAHHMALLAMAQYGLLIADKLQQAKLFYFSETFELADSGLSVWIPDKALLNVSELEQNWSITSDSLSLWLAQQINANELHVIKRTQSPTASIQRLCEEEIIDSAFVSLYSHKKILTKLYKADTLVSYPKDGVILG